MPVFALKHAPIAIAFAAIVALHPGGSRAEPFHGLYEAQWGGLRAAEFTLSIDEDSGQYTADFALQTRSVFDWWLKLAVEARTLGMPGSSPSGNGSGLSPGEFEVQSRSRWRERQVVVRFDPERDVADATRRTVVVSEPSDPEAGNDDRDDTLLPEAWRKGVIDPLGAVVGALDHVRAHLAGGPAERVLHVFDGRRRFDVPLFYEGRVERTLGDRARPVHLVRLEIRPVAGFRSSQREFWEKTAFEVALSTDGRFIPLQIMSLGAGPVFNLVELCRDRCVIPARDS